MITFSSPSIHAKTRPIASLNVSILYSYTPVRSATGSVHKYTLHSIILQIISHSVSLSLSLLLSLSLSLSLSPNDF